MKKEELPYELTMIYEAAKRARNEMFIIQITSNKKVDFTDCIMELDRAIIAARKLLNKEVEL